MSKAIYGGRDAVNVDRVEDAVDMMVKAQDEKKYDRGLRYMYYLLDGFDEKDDIPEPKHPLLAYFMRNWNSCKDMRAVYERGHVAHLGNYTNNRLESAWGDLKEILKPEMELDECVETLSFLQSTAELEYGSRFNVIGSRHYHGADAVLLRLAALVSRHAFDLVRQEYELFKGGSLAYEGRWLHDGIVQLRSTTTEREYVVNTSTYTCSCFFMRTMLLPCHHTMFVRSNLKKKNAIPINYINPRWLLQPEANRPEEDESDDDISCSAFRVHDSNMRSVKHAVLDGSTKWRTGMHIAERVVEAMSSQGTHSFLRMAEALRKFGEYASQGIVPNLGIPEGDQPRNNDVEFDNEYDASGADSFSLLNSQDCGDELSDGFDAPPTLKTKAKQLINEVQEDDAGMDADDMDSDSTNENARLENEQEKSTQDLVNEGARLIAETDRIVRPSRKMVSSESEGETQAKPSKPDPLTAKATNPAKTYNLAVKAALSGDVPVKSVKSPKQLVKDPKQLVKDHKQLVKDHKQLVKDHKQLVKSSGQLIIRKRSKKSMESGDVNDESSSSEDSIRRFEIIKSTTSKGRPKIRKKQQREVKRLRMEESKEVANTLAQGTLVPVKDLALVCNTLACSFNVIDALPVVFSITQVDAAS